MAVAAPGGGGGEQDLKSEAANALDVRGVELDVFAAHAAQVLVQRADGGDVDDLGKDEGSRHGLELLPVSIGRLSRSRNGLALRGGAHLRNGARGRSGRRMNRRVHRLGRAGDAEAADEAV